MSTEEWVSRTGISRIGGRKEKGFRARRRNKYSF
jgi:hypothetical protein